jgi:ribonuclease G
MSKLLFVEYKQKLVGLLIQDGRVTAVAVRPLMDESAPKIGAVYIGKVKQVLQNIGACFVDIGDKEDCFLSFSNLHSPLLTNRNYTGSILQGDELVVQVSGDPVKQKQRTVTAKVTLQGRYFILSTDAPRLNFSSKIPKAARRLILEHLEEKGIVDDSHTLIQKQRSNCDDGDVTFGLIVRTLLGSILESSDPAVWHEVWSEYDTLYHELVTICTQYSHRTVFSCLKEAPDLFESILEQIGNEEIDEIITDIPSLYQQMTKKLQASVLTKQIKVRLYPPEETISLSKLYSIETKIRELLHPKVWLKSGAYLLIEPTEALTVIDVNTGKAIHTATKAATKVDKNILQINLEAAEEIAIQLRARNISGIVIIDFISMRDKEFEKQLLGHLRGAVKKDPTKVNVMDITSLGLVELTRKRSESPLKEQLSIERNPIERNRND